MTAVSCKQCQQKTSVPLTEGHVTGMRLTVCLSPQSNFIPCCSSPPSLTRCHQLAAFSHPVSHVLEAQLHLEATAAVRRHCEWLIGTSGRLDLRRHEPVELFMLGRLLVSPLLLCYIRTIHVGVNSCLTSACGSGDVIFT